MTRKIFITIPWFLPAFRAGGPIQSVANLVREFQEDVEYYIFCGDTDINGAALENVTTGEWVPFNSCTKVWYAGPEKISHKLDQQVGIIRPDILYIIGLYDWHFNIVPLVFCKAPKKILSVRGMLHPGALSQKKFKKTLYLGLFKLLDYHHDIFFHATDDIEAGYIRGQFGTVARIGVAGNFPTHMEVLPIPYKEPGKLRMISIGLISPMKNMLDVLGALQGVGGSIEYSIYGPVKDHDYYDACKAAASTLPPECRVLFGGEVFPQEVPAKLAQAHVFILPSKSENFGHALYEALAAGRPVITSHDTPWNNLEAARAGLNVETGSSSILASAIRTFLEMDEATFSQWHQGAAAYAAAAVDVPRLREAYRELFSIAPPAAIEDPLQEI